MWPRRPTLLRFAADTIFCIHLGVVCILAFGWMFKWPFRGVYIVLLVAELALVLFNQACPLTIAEFRMRRRIDPILTMCDNYITYYGLSAMRGLGVSWPADMQLALRVVAGAFLSASLMVQLIGLMPLRYGARQLEGSSVQRYSLVVQPAAQRTVSRSAAAQAQLAQ